ncbi:MAG: tRNA uridine-5-carboxymethylaminomethyl(34) synthesis GTPase MnmE [Bacteroidetes bacterium]|nr:tRNA uridine-5-carboxymethylaminomethyl(34) synthesis GTPase MnmE [Bacteroidota bacterium]
MNVNNYDTIAAISTPIGEGGISVIRVSGDKAFEKISSIFFKDKSGKNNFDIGSLKSHTIHFGYVFNRGEIIDEAVLSIFKSPHSYTGEDVLEISSHGGVLVTQKVLAAILSLEIRHAEPGEFTKRAFLNSKIDLSQAEAVADLIKSKTDSAHQSSIKQLEGSLSDFVKKTRQDLINLTSLVELELDFAEEDLEFVKKDELKEKILSLIKRIEGIIATYISGKVIREGVNLVIAGQPNSGKSSLFNYLLKTNRAIVSNVEGTTRDYIQENLIINGVLFNLIDTAGLRFSEDEIESEGIKRSYEKITEADLILYLIDASDKEEKINESLAYYNHHIEKEKSILVYTKIDKAEIEKQNEPAISLLKDDSIESLKKLMTEKVTGKGISSGSSDIILTNLRHKVCLENVVASLENSVKTIEDGMTGEFISVDFRNAMKYLGEITGEVTNDEILNNIFANFCIGK